MLEHESVGRFVWINQLIAGFFCFSFVTLKGVEINEAACDIARGVANEGNALVAGGVSQTPVYRDSSSETEVKAAFKKQLDVFLKKDVDFLIVEVLDIFGGQCGYYLYRLWG